MATTISNNDDNIRLNQIIDNGLNIYGSREKIRADLITLAKKYLKISQNSDISKASYIAYLIDMLSILSSNQIYYQSKIYSEFFIVTAVMMESVQNLAKWIGYTIPKAKCATVQVMFVMPLKFTTPAVNFSLGKYFETRAGEIPFTIKSDDNIFDNKSTSAVFSLDNQKLKYASKGQIINNSAITIRDYTGEYRPVYVGKDGSYCAFNLEFEQCKYEIQSFNIPIDLQLNQFYHHDLTFQGQVADLKVFICEPKMGQTLSLNSIQMDNVQKVETFDPSQPIIDSAGNVCQFIEWTECINGIYTISSTRTEFDWVGYYNRGILSFGNGILGKQPAPGSFVVCVLKITEGSKGNVINNVITTGDEILVKLDGSSEANISYTCRNNNAAYGGVDILTTSEIKNNAIINLKTRKRLVTDDDYENITAVVENTTMSDCVPILKRSDIKINDITLYFILNYLNKGSNEFVPTRNAQYDLIAPTWNGDNQIIVNKNTPIKVGPEELPFVTIFNMVLDKATRMAYYNYTATNVQGVASELYTQSVYDTLQQSTYFNLTTTDFSIDYDSALSINGKYPVYIKVNITNIPNKVLMKNGPTDTYVDRMDKNYKWIVNDFDPHFSDNTAGADTFNYFEIAHFKGIMTTKWGDFETYDEFSVGYTEDYEITESTQDGKVFSEKKYKSIVFSIPTYTDIPQGKQRYEFDILCYVPKTDADGYIYAIHDCKEVRAVDPNGRYYDAEGADVTDEVVMVWKPLKKYYSDVIILQDMSDYMQSSISVDNKYKGVTQYDSDGNLVDVYHVNEVPTIYQLYYNDVMQKENSDFELSVIQKLLENINFEDKRMMTDFTNIKFADTYGSLKNLMYNVPDYIVESRYSHTPWWEKQQGTKDWPADVATRRNIEYVEPMETEAPIYYIANGKIDSMGSVPVSEYYGFIVLRIPTTNPLSGVISYSYTVIEPNVGTCIKIKDELDYDGNMQTCYWTGHEWMPVEQYSIPMKLELRVQINEDTVSMSDDAMKEEIIRVVSEYYNDSTKMGLQKQIDRSEITKVCRSIQGVQYVEVLNPQFDIKFDYEINKLSQKDLLGFTPQYIGFRTLTDTVQDYKETSISVEIVRK